MVSQLKSKTHVYLVIFVITFPLMSYLAHETAYMRLIFTLNFRILVLYIHVTVILQKTRLFNILSNGVEEGTGDVKNIFSKTDSSLSGALELTKSSSELIKSHLHLRDLHSLLRTCQVSLIWIQIHFANEYLQM